MVLMLGKGCKEGVGKEAMGTGGEESGRLRMHDAAFFVFVLYCFLE